MQTKSVTASATGPLHAPVLEQLDGLFQTTQAGWNEVAKYASWIITDKRAAQAVVSAGMKLGMYTDEIHIHGDFINSWPEAAFAHSCDGQRIYNGTQSAYANIGDPRSQALADSMNGLIDSMVKDQYGSYPYSFVMADDSDDPGETWDPTQFRYGSVYGPIALPIYCGYSKSSWFSAISNLYQNAHLPVFFNGYTSVNYWPYMQGKSNIIGGMCEDCFTTAWLTNGIQKATGTDWSQEMQAALTAVTNGKVFFDSAYGSSADDLGYAYANLMLYYDQNLSIFRQDGPSNSQLGAPITSVLVPTDPIIPTPSTVSGLLWPTQTYAREYRACYLKGQLVGPCAAVVNPDPVSWHGWPYLTREYHHLLQFGGQGSATSLGDTGWINADGPHPGNGIPAMGWAIAFN